MLFMLKVCIKVNKVLIVGSFFFFFVLIFNYIFVCDFFLFICYNLMKFYEKFCILLNWFFIDD